MDQHPHIEENFLQSAITEKRRGDKKKHMPQERHIGLYHQEKFQTEMMIVPPLGVLYHGGLMMESPLLKHMCLLMKDPTGPLQQGHPVLTKF